MTGYEETIKILHREITWLNNWRESVEKWVDTAIENDHKQVQRVKALEKRVEALEEQTG